MSPHTVLLDNDSVLERFDSHYKVKPPLRGEDDRQALIEGLSTEPWMRSLPITGRKTSNTSNWNFRLQLMA